LALTELRKKEGEETKGKKKRGGKDIGGRQWHGNHAFQHTV